MKIKNKALPLAFALLAIGSLGISLGASVALFERSTALGKEENSVWGNLEINSNGAKNTNLYLDLNSVWTVGGDDNISVWVLKWNSTKIEINESDINAFEWEEMPNSVTTISGVNYYKFDFNNNLYNKLSFHRIKAASGTPTTFRQRYSEDSGGFAVNSTSILSKPTDKNVYQITSWTTGGSYGFLSGGQWVNHMYTA